MRVYYFYKLTDPREPELVRFVGSTTENLNVRLSKLISECVHTDKKSKLAVWVRDLFDIDLRPLINMVEVSERITEEQANARQEQLIDEYQQQGFADLNMTKSRGTGGHTYKMEEERKEKISQTMSMDLDLVKLADLRQSGLSWKKCAAEMGVAYLTAYKRKEEIEEILSQRGKSN